MNKKVLSKSYPINPLSQLIKDGKIILPSTLDLWSLRAHLEKNQFIIGNGYGVFSVNIKGVNPGTDVCEIPNLHLKTRRDAYIFHPDIKSPSKRPQLNFPGFNELIDNILAIFPKGSVEFGQSGLQERYIAPHDTQPGMPWHRDPDTDIIVILWAATDNVKGGELQYAGLPHQYVIDSQTKNITPPPPKGPIETYNPHTFKGALVFDNGVNMHNVCDMSNDSDQAARRLSLTLTLRVVGQRLTETDEDRLVSIYRYPRGPIETKLEEWKAKTAKSGSITKHLKSHL